MRSSRVSTGALVMLLNGAVAVGMSEGTAGAYRRARSFGGARSLKLHAAGADMLRRFGSFEAAAGAYRHALSLMAKRCRARLSGASLAML